MKLLSWNVNGIRACHRNGFVDWFAAQDADVVCIQETKAHPEQLDEGLLHPLGYHSYWHSARKKGYSGVATYCRRRPQKVIEGIGESRFDREGRVLITEFRGFALVNAYFPNTQHDHARLRYKLEFCRAMRRLLDAYRAEGRNVVLCGDHNIAHEEIDLARPKDNVKNHGFTPQERESFGEHLQSGFVDSFRHFTAEGGHYTWWRQFGGARERNVGWRLDYVLVSEELREQLRSATILSSVMGSDHCPVAAELSA